MQIAASNLHLFSQREGVVVFAASAHCELRARDRAAAAPALFISHCSPPKASRGPKAANLARRSEIWALRACCGPFRCAALNQGALCLAQRSRILPLRDSYHPAARLAKVFAAAAQRSMPGDHSLVGPHLASERGPGFALARQAAA